MKNLWCGGKGRPSGQHVEYQRDTVKVRARALTVTSRLPPLSSCSKRCRRRGHWRRCRLAGCRRPQRLSHLLLTRAEQAVFPRQQHPDVLSQCLRQRYGKLSRCPHTEISKVGFVGHLSRWSPCRPVGPGEHWFRTCVHWPWRYEGSVLLSCNDSSFGEAWCRCSSLTMLKPSSTEMLRSKSKYHRHPISALR